MPSDKRLAHITGLIYLVLFVSGSFPLFVQSKVIIAGDAAATAANILEHEWLFRLSIVSELVMSLAYLMVAYLLYLLLRRSGQHLALLFLVLAATGVASICANLIHLVATLELLVGRMAETGVAPEMLQASASFFMLLFSRGWTISGMFTGLWLLPLGLLLFRSARVPRLFGVLLIIGCFGYLVPIVTVFLWPEFKYINLPVMSVSGLAEISFGLWLLFRGMRDPVMDSSQSMTAAGA